MKKIGLWILVGVVVLLLAAYLGVGYMVYDKFSLIVPFGERTENTPADFQIIYDNVKNFDTTPYLMPVYEEVSFSSRDPKITLAGWYIPGDEGAPAVVVTHGIGAAKYAGNILTIAGMLHKNGFNVLMFDLRNHGQSTVDDGRTSIGNREYKDVLGAWDYLINVRGFSPERVGVFGLSLGGASTLDAFAEEPRIAAIMVDSPFSNLQQVISEELVRNGYPSMLAPASILTARLINGVDLLEHSPQDAILKNAGRPMYLVHGLIDQRINVHHTRDLVSLADQKGVVVQAWFVEGADHVCAEFVAPAEYEQKMAAFYTQALEGD